MAKKITAPVVIRNHLPGNVCIIYTDTSYTKTKKKTRYKVLLTEPACTLARASKMRSEHGWGIDDKKGIALQTVLVDNGFPCVLVLFGRSEVLVYLEWPITIVEG